MGRETTISILSNDVFGPVNHGNAIIAIVAVVAVDTV